MRFKLRRKGRTKYIFRVVELYALFIFALTFRKLVTTLRIVIIQTV